MGGRRSRRPTTTTMEKQEDDYYVGEAAEQQFVLLLNGKIVRHLDSNMTRLEAHRLARKENMGRLRGTR